MVCRGVLAVVMLLCACAVHHSIAAPAAEVELITEPRPGEEYVLVQGHKAQQNTAAEKRDFSTAHQIPSVQEKQALTREAAEKGRSFATSHKVSRPAQVPNKNDESADQQLRRDTRQTSVAPTQRKWFGTHLQL
ncbi:uncharacterized protein LOC120350154 isoform X2 [Nilaparvata lugens]|uniref:uncharacterized protein LOC120350154 isoform X2 n=1 Tax=Nilaparvata lugens TaxID=108931 RepID=UPI00193D8A7D|nr:uncharacterized protein LOC120350154 isoform X2 [Nilaparvata lugens]